MFSQPVPETVTIFDKVKTFMSAHWRGVLCVAAPLIFLPVILPSPSLPHQWTGYTLLIMATFWVSECIPLAVTSFLPVLIFPLSGVMTAREACKSYLNDTLLMFLGSLILAYSVEQSGLHKRLAYAAIRRLGYSHLRLLLAMSCVTMFVSMWITNTAATTMMVPIIFAVLRVFENQGLLKIYETTPSGDVIASDITTCYFCAATYSATIGGCGTLVGTGTNLAFKGLFQSTYPEAKDYLSFPLFLAFGVPLMIVNEISCYVVLGFIYFGLFRKNSKIAKLTNIPKAGKEAAAKAIAEDTKRMGRFSFWEAMVVILFFGAMIAFFCRSPQIFTGWGDIINSYFSLNDNKFVRDSALAIFVCFLMFLLPSTLKIFKNCRAKFYEDLPKGRIMSVLDWIKINADMPFSFMFLLGGGFCLSDAAKSSGLNEKIGVAMKGFLIQFPNQLILLILVFFVIFVTNFASNVAVCNVMTPLAMQMAVQIKINPLWYCIASGFAASYCFMLPVGTPGNLVVQSAAKIPTRKMIKAGVGPTLTVCIITWLAMWMYAPLVWPDLNTFLTWEENSG